MEENEKQKEADINTEQQEKQELYRLLLASQDLHLERSEESPERGE
jgi:hypothetical protein